MVLLYLLRDRQYIIKFFNMNTSKKSSMCFTYGTAETQNFYQLGAIVCFSLTMRSAGLSSKKTPTLRVAVDISIG